MLAQPLFGAIGMARIFISYRDQKPDKLIAQDFYDGLKKAGHNPFLASESIRWGQNWESRIMAELESCDYFLLLLSIKSLSSEMVAGEVRKAKELHDTGTTNKPMILPLRVKLPVEASMDYELACYLHKFQHRSWNSEQDTAIILQELISLIESGNDSYESIIEDIPTVAPAPEDPPLPTVPLEVPEGQVSQDSPFYIVRNSDLFCYQEVLKKGSLIRIKAPRQFGKTSLLSRLISHAKANDHQVVSLSFQQLDAVVFSDLEVLLKQLCIYASFKLNVQNQVEECWQDLLGFKQCCSSYFEDKLLKNSEKPVVLAFDEADRLFEYPKVSAEFFGMLRYWHEQGKNNETWSTLKILIAHSTEAHLAISDITQSPFNVGLDIKLNEFSPDEVMQLAELHKLAWNNTEVEQLMSMIGGHPYLVRKALYDIATHQFKLDVYLKSSTTDEGPFSDHLRRHLWALQQQKDLVEAIRNIIKYGSCHDVNLCYKLRAAGLIRGHAPKVELRFELYRQYFEKYL